MGSLSIYHNSLCYSPVPGSDGFAVGNKASLADVAIYRLLKDVQPPYDASFQPQVVKAYEACPKIKADLSRPMLGRASSANLGLVWPSSPLVGALGGYGWC